MGPDSPQHILRPAKISTIVVSFVLALLLLCGEWIGRRAAGYR